MPSSKHAVSLFSSECVISSAQSYISDVATNKKISLINMQNGNCRVIIPKHVEFEALCGTQCSGCKFELVTNKKISRNLHE